MKIDPWKGITTAVLSIYYIWYMLSDPLHNFSNWNIIDDVDLIIHEAGHFIFLFFGEFIHILGGDGVIHDWNYLLSHTGLLNYTDILSRIVYGAGVVIILLAINLCVKFSFKNTVEPARS